MTRLEALLPQLHNELVGPVLVDDGGDGQLVAL